MQTCSLYFECEYVDTGSFQLLMIFSWSHKNRRSSGVDVNDQMVNVFSIVRLRGSGIN